MSMNEDFQEFHKNNPQVYELFRRFTFQAIDAGRKDFGAKAVMERIRWSTMVETSGDTYKLNNNYTAFYARMLMDSHPEHEGLFKTRRSKADETHEGVRLSKKENVVRGSGCMAPGVIFETSHVFGKDSHADLLAAESLYNLGFFCAMGRH